MTDLLDIDGPAAPPRRNGELVFAEPWESRAFGLALTLDANGTLPWGTFRQHLIATIGDHVEGREFSYYRCWLYALENALVAAGVVDYDDLERRGDHLATRESLQVHPHD